MDQKLVNNLAGMNTEERASYLAANKSDLASAALNNANGGGENPNSSAPYGGNYYSSPGWICNGERRC